MISIVCFFLNFIILFISLKLNKTIFSKIYILGLLLVSILIFTGGLKDKSSVFEEAIFFLLISNIGVLIFTFVNFNYKPPKQKIEINRISNIIKLYFFSFLSVYLLIIAVGGVSNVFNSWITVKNQIGDESGLRISSIFFFLLSHVYIRRVKFTDYKYFFVFVIPILTLILFVIILRVKLFIIPIVFALFIPKGLTIMRLGKILKISTLFIISYFLIMFFRWYGDVSEIYSERSSEVFNNVLSSGLEREMYNQFISVYYYYSHHPVHFGQAYIRLLWEPINRLLDLNLTVENPMYFYYTISNNNLFVRGGSAHPSIYGDSFASFGLLGAFIPSFWMIFIKKVEIYFESNFGEILFVALSILIPLVVRGSIYYGLLYFSFLFLVWIFINKKLHFYK